MRGFVRNIEAIAVANIDFRRVLHTAQHCQLVVMALKLKMESCEETHGLDQCFRVEEGAGVAVLGGVTTAITVGFAIVIPAGVKHNIVNTGSSAMKRYKL